MIITAYQIKNELKAHHKAAFGNAPSLHSRNLDATSDFFFLQYYFVWAKPPYAAPQSVALITCRAAQHRTLRAGRR
jgi:hypothetical protein